MQSEVMDLLNNKNYNIAHLSEYLPQLELIMVTWYMPHKLT